MAAGLRHHQSSPPSGYSSDQLLPPPDMPRRPAAAQTAGMEANVAGGTSGRGHRLSRLRIGSASPTGDEGVMGLSGGAPSGGADSGGGSQRAGLSSPALPAAAAPPWRPWSPEEAERALSMAASNISGAAFRVSESQVHLEGDLPIPGGGSKGDPRRPPTLEQVPPASGAAVRQYGGEPGPLGEAFEEWGDSGGSSPLPPTPGGGMSSVAAGASFLASRGDKSVRKMSQYRSRGMTVSWWHCCTAAVPLLYLSLDSLIACHCTIGVDNPTV